MQKVKSALERFKRNGPAPSKGKHRCWNTCEPGLNRNVEHCIDNVAHGGGVVKKGEFMRFRSSFRLFKKKKPRPGFLTVMMCIQCGYIWEASNIGNPCPKCANSTVVAMARWQPAKYGMPALGRSVDYGNQPRTGA